MAYLRFGHVVIFVWLFYAAPGAPEYLTIWAPEMLFIAIGAILFKSMLRDSRAHNARIGEFTRLRESVERRIDEMADPNAIRVYSYRFPRPAFALRGPAIDSLREPAAVLQRLDTAFPTVGACSP